MISIITKAIIRFFTKPKLVWVAVAHFEDSKGNKEWQVIYKIYYKYDYFYLRCKGRDYRNHNYYAFALNKLIYYQLNNEE